MTSACHMSSNGLFNCAITFCHDVFLRRLCSNPRLTTCKSQSLPLGLLSTRHVVPTPNKLGWAQDIVLTVSPSKLLWEVCWCPLPVYFKLVSLLRWLYFTHACDRFVIENNNVNKCVVTRAACSHTWRDAAACHYRVTLHNPEIVFNFMVLSTRTGLLTKL